MAFSFEIVERVAVLSEAGNGVTLELNRISYNGERPKWDLRRWKDGEGGERRMLKGTALNDDEFESLRRVLAAMGGEADDGQQTR